MVTIKILDIEYLFKLIIFHLSVLSLRFRIFHRDRHSHRLMFYDLNIPWRTPDDELRRTVALLDHCILSFVETCLTLVGYSVIAFNVVHTGKLPSIIVSSCNILD